MSSPPPDPHAMITTTEPFPIMWSPPSIIQTVFFDGSFHSRFLLRRRAQTGWRTQCGVWVGRESLASVAKATNQPVVEKPTLSLSSALLVVCLRRSCEVNLVVWYVSGANGVYSLLTHNTIYYREDDGTLSVVCCFVFNERKTWSNKFLLYIMIFTKPAWPKPLLLLNDCLIFKRIITT